MVVQIAMTLNDAVSVLRVFAQQGREVHAPSGCAMRHRAVPGTGFVVAVTRPDSMDPAALAIWRAGTPRRWPGSTRIGLSWSWAARRRSSRWRGPSGIRTAGQDERRPCLSTTLRAS
jgi:hypothetical protein